MNKYIRRENRRVAYKAVKEALNSPSLDVLVKVIVDYREQKKIVRVDDDLKEEIENCLSFIINNLERDEIECWVDEGYWDNDDNEESDE